nr:reverse transcriptase domain-containing protein [Tanacetum cinerariifolium]
FTKLIIYYLQSKHKFHPRPDSPLHLPNEEPGIGYIKFSAKGTKREVFGMLISNELITANIQGIPEKEPRFDNEEADIQRAVEESLKSVHDAPRELGLTDSDTESDKEVPHVVKIRAQDKGQARPNPSVLTKGQAGSGPGDDAETQPQSSHVVHAGPNLKHMDLEATDVSTQLYPEQMDEGDSQEPASSTGTLSSLQHLAKDFSFSDLFFNDKPSKAENEKTTLETEAESMVSVTIQQDTSTIPPMTTPVIDLTSRPDSPNSHRPLQATVTETTMTTTTTTTTHPPPPQPQQSTTNSMLIKRIRELKQIMMNLIQDNKYLEERYLPEADMKEILHQRMWETNSYKAHEDHMMLCEALKKSMNRDHTDELLKDLAEARKKKKKRRDSPKMPPGSPPQQPPPPPPPAGPSGTPGSPGAFGSSQMPPPHPPPPSTNQEGQSHGSTAPISSKTAALAEYTAWTTTDTRLRSYVSLILKDLHMDDDMAPDEHVHSSDDEDIEIAHILKVNLRHDWWKPLEEDRPTTPEPAWSIPSSDLPTAGDHRNVQINEPNELRDQAYENSLIYKEKSKRLHDSKIKNRVFNIGDRVLLFNSRLEIFFGKLKSRWSGPFTISYVYPYGTVGLSQPDGPNFKVNGHCVKHYFGEDVPKLVVPDL